MRIATFARLILVLLVAACAPNRAPSARADPSQCPNKVVATVTNRDYVSYDVYYQDDRNRSILGEVSAGSTVTFPLPGEGRGSVSVQRPQGDGGGITARNSVQIRIHCAET